LEEELIALGRWEERCQIGEGTEKNGTLFKTVDNISGRPVR